MSLAPQLELGLDAVSDEPPLVERLRAQGLPAAIAVETHANRRVLVSLSSRGALRVHRGYAAAPDTVIAAIARWARPRLPRAERRAAQRILTGFPVHLHVAAERQAVRRPEAPRPGDERILERLRALHGELNRRHFDARLGEPQLLLSSRMQRRLGEFRPGCAGSPAEICLSRRHLRRDGWRGVEETLLHEMVHQWQAETGRRLGHGADFRLRCKEIGIAASATRRREPSCRAAERGP